MQYEVNFAVSRSDGQWGLLLKATTPDGSWSYLNNLNGLDSLLGLDALPEAGNEEIAFDGREGLQLAVGSLLDGLDCLDRLLDEDRRAGEWNRPET